MRSARFLRTVDRVASIQEKDIIQAFDHAGQQSGYRDFVQKLPQWSPVRDLASSMRMVFRKIPGIDGDRQRLLASFRATRIRFGCSSVFFTLNPHAQRSPFTVSFASASDTQHFEHPFSFDSDDSDVSRYFEDLTKRDPEFLRKLLVREPVASQRAFHNVLCLQLRELLHLSGVSLRDTTLYLDGVCSETTPGIFGRCSAFIGAVEPQQRKVLHVHLLIHLHGFGHPHDLEQHADLRQALCRLWALAVSITCRSVESYADYLDDPAAMSELARLPKLPLTQMEKKKLHPALQSDTPKQQLLHRGLDSSVVLPERPLGHFTHYTKKDLGNLALTSADWCRLVMRLAADAIPICRLHHICRSDTCFKGLLGSKACRMRYFHWCKTLDDRGAFQATICHGRLCHIILYTASCSYAMLSLLSQ